MPILSYWNTKDQDILSEMEKKKSPIVREILDLLRFSGKLPQFKIDPKLPYGTSGEYNPLNDTLGFNRWSGNRASTMAHELTHALSDRMARDAFRWKNSKDELPVEQSRFVDAMQKLRTPSFKGTGDPYRDNREEQWGFGVGAFPGTPLESWEKEFAYPGVPHQDPTNATEQAVLRDLYRRALQSKR